MSGNLSLEDLKVKVSKGEIDTVIAAQVDMQGRLMGKRFQANFFLDSAIKESHSCNYLLATDLEMATVSGYAASSWERGYSDYTMIPDLSTLRVIPWLKATALVICDIIDHHSHQEVPHSPRAMLKAQIARLEKMGMKAMMATELEFYMFKQSYEEASKMGYRNLDLSSSYNQDYHILQTSKEEEVLQAIRNGLYGAGIPVEGTKGEAAAGQGEINVRYSDALDTADNHVITKNGCKEIAWGKGRALTFLAKYHNDLSGSSSHVHQSLWSMDGKPLFLDPKGNHGMSSLMEHFLAGQMKYADDITYFLAPYINSYKRFAKGTFAPTKSIWSLDNRTAGFRICGDHSKSIRIECRIGGSDLNPYLAMAALLAAGIEGVEQKLPLCAEFKGDAYQAASEKGIAPTLREAIISLRNSQLLRKNFGDEVINHYCHAAEWEQEEYDRRITDWEIARGFERG